MHQDLFIKITKYFSLGNLVQSPKKILIGILHSVWWIQTDSGQYVVKLLQVEHVNTNLLSPQQSNELAKIMQAAQIPTVVALEIKNDCVAQLYGFKVMVLPWVQGKHLSAEKISPKSLVKLGKIVAKMHLINISSIAAKKPIWQGLDNTNWCQLISSLKNNTTLSSYLESHLPQLDQWSILARKASLEFQEHVFSHRDLDDKNVLWHYGKPTLLDWEYAGWIPPLLDILIVALNWSGAQYGQLNKSHFVAVLEGYHSIKEIPGVFTVDVLHLYFGYCLDWLIFAIQQGYEEEIFKTIRAIALVEEHQDLILAWGMLANSHLFPLPNAGESR